MNFDIKKYPRTPHLEGSKLQDGDEDLSQIKFSSLAGKHLVIEEKVDGANVALSFDEQKNLLLQSRGHYLTGGTRENHYNLFKRWANAHAQTFYSVLGSRYIMYGEWMQIKHKIFYDALPSYFLEFDILDRQTGIFLDTPSRQILTEKLNISSAKTLFSGKVKSKKELLSYLGNSNYKTPQHITRLKEYCAQNNIDFESVLAQTDMSMLMEGLYIKVEENGQVVDRLKFVRSGFLQAQSLTTIEWQSQKIIQNGLTVPLEKLFEE